MTSKSFRLWLKVSVSVGLLLVLAVVLPWHEVAGALSKLSPGEWSLVLLGLITGHTVGVFKWRLFVNAGHAALGRLDAMQCYWAGLFANLCLPSIVGGDVLRLALAGKITKRPETVFLGGVLDRLTDMVALTILVIAGGLTSRHALPGWGRGVVSVIVVVGTIFIGLTLPFVLRRPLQRWPRRIRRPVGRALVAVRRLAREPGRGLAGLGLSLTIQTGFVLLNAHLGREIGINVPVSVWFLVWPLAKIAGLLPISLGGLAVRETTLAALLAPFGVPFAVGVTCSLLWQTVLIGAGLFGGLVWLVLSRLRAGVLDHPIAVIHQVTQTRHG